MEVSIAKILKIEIDVCVDFTRIVYHANTEMHITPTAGAKQQRL